MQTTLRTTGALTDSLGNLHNIPSATSNKLGYTGDLHAVSVISVLRKVRHQPLAQEGLPAAAYHRPVRAVTGRLGELYGVLAYFRSSSLRSSLILRTWRLVSQYALSATYLVGPLFRPYTYASIS